YAERGGTEKPHARNTKHQAPNTKQAPDFKHQTPNSKLQKNFNVQIPKSQRPRHPGSDRPKAMPATWILEFGACLVFGVWSLVFWARSRPLRLERWRSRGLLLPFGVGVRI